MSLRFFMVEFVVNAFSEENEKSVDDGDKTNKVYRRGCEDTKDKIMDDVKCIND